MRLPALLAYASVLATATAWARPAGAGGGPETTLVVVNADSPSSLRVANEWVRRRHVPPSHVCAIAGVPSLHVIDVDTFRRRVLEPVEAYLKDHGLSDRIDLVVYSVDFPYGVDFRTDGPSAAGSVPPVASLTGLTYLGRLVEKKAVEEYQRFADGCPNGYFRRTADQNPTGEASRSRGFSCRPAWTGADEPDPAAPADSTDRHRLSVMLGYTGTWGNSVPEVLAYLGAAVGSDGTNPAGTVYLCRSEDAARTGPRAQFFDATVQGLAALGRKAVVLSKDDPGQTGVLPVAKDDVLGAVVGAAGFSWKDSKSRLLPGSIAEHLTSFGGKFDGAGQTKCTEFLRYGAAGSCGTVVEPLNAWTKFPVPQLHVHYAAGCSLAESFYEAVASPYQLLILGDPLARPFARFATVEVAVGGGAAGAAVAGKVDVVARVTPAADRPIGRVELWVDGLYVGEGKPGEALSWDTTAADEGTHEVRAVAVEAGPVETRSYASAVVSVANRTRASQSLAHVQGSTPLDGMVTLSGKAPGAREVTVLSGFRAFATVPVQGDAWKAAFPATRLGMGTVTLQVRSTYPDGGASRSPFFDVVVAEPEWRRSLVPVGKTPPPKGKGKPAPAAGSAGQGLLATVTGADGKAVEMVLSDLGGPGVETVRKQIEAKAKGPFKRIVIVGEIEVKTASLYQLDVSLEGDVEVDVDGKPLVASTKATLDRILFAAAALDAGWHSLAIRWSPAGAPDLSLLFAGDQVAVPLSGASVRRGAR